MDEQLLAVDEILLKLLALCHQQGQIPHYQQLFKVLTSYLDDPVIKVREVRLCGLSPDSARREIQLLVDLTSSRVRGLLYWQGLYPTITREGLHRAETIQLPPDIEQLAQQIIDQILLSKEGLKVT